MRFSSVIQKIIVSLTGIFLYIFLVVHLIGNLQLLLSDGGLAFNTYAVFMTNNPLIKLVSWGLYGIILLHTFQGLVLTMKNRKARGVSYARSANSTNSTWYSRSMALLGIVIFVFIVVHMANFWFKYKFGATPYATYTEHLGTGEIVKTYTSNTARIQREIEEFSDGVVRTVIVKDLFRTVQVAFQTQLWIVLFYVLAMIALAFHLLHGVQSSIQTLGIRNRIVVQTVRILGIWVFAILIPLAFALIPIYIYLTA